MTAASRPRWPVSSDDECGTASRIEAQRRAASSSAQRLCASKTATLHAAAAASSATMCSSEKRWSSPARRTKPWHADAVLVRAAPQALGQDRLSSSAAATQALGINAAGLAEAASSEGEHVGFAKLFNAKTHPSKAAARDRAADDRGRGEIFASSAIRRAPQYNAATTPDTAQTSTAAARAAAAAASAAGTSSRPARGTPSASASASPAVACASPWKKSPAAPPRPPPINDRRDDVRDDLAADVSPSRPMKTSRAARRGSMRDGKQALVMPGAALKASAAEATPTSRNIRSNPTRTISGKESAAAMTAATGFLAENRTFPPERRRSGESIVADHVFDDDENDDDDAPRPRSVSSPSLSLDNAAAYTGVRANTPATTALA